MKKFVKNILKILIISSYLNSCSFLQPQRELSSAQDRFCGDRLIEARMFASELPWEKEQLKKIATPYKKDIFEIWSRSSLNQLQIFLGTLSITEKKLFEKIQNFDPPVIHRVPFERLRAVFKEGALISPREKERHAEAMPSNQIFTPLLEDSLFDAYDCIFVSVGPPFGRERYGEVMFKIKSSDSFLWATPSSGWSFIKESRQRKPEINEQTTLDDRLHFSLGIVAQRDFKKYFAFIVIAHLRMKTEEGTSIMQLLLNIQNDKEFWAVIDNKRLGYLEGRYEAKISLEQFESIEVPQKYYNEILSWPESEKFLKIIKFIGQ